MAKLATIAYKPYCEQLYQSWLKDAACFWEFRLDFEPEFLPEPYLIFRSGSRKLCVLNYNPGQPLKTGVQSREYIVREYSGKNYQEIAKSMAEYYLKELSTLGPKAWHRINDMIEFASGLGFDGVENVETFFLHSRNINARAYLQKYGENIRVKEYTQSLTAYLKEMPVLIIAAISPMRSITLDTLAADAWIAHLCKIASMELTKAKLTPVTQKGDKITSCIVANGNKYLSVCMGSNRLAMPSK